MAGPERSDPHRERERLYLAGLGIHAASVAATFVYTLADPHPAGRDRLLLLLAGAATALLVVLALVPARTFTGDRRWNRLIWGWSGSCIVAIGLAVWLDGAGSPLSMLFIAPLLFSGLAAPRPVAIGLAALDLVTAAVALALADGASVGRFAVVAGTLAGTAWYTLWRVDSHEQNAARLEVMSHTDPLTGSLNRRGFEAALAGAAAAHARGELGGFTLVVVDLDRFKAVNDRDGHAAGDAVLCRVAEAMRTALRTGDRVGRLGGDEFAALLLGSAAPSAGPAARIDAALELAGVAASIGAAHFPADAPDADALQHVADRAMYAAKRGRTAA